MDLGRFFSDLWNNGGHLLAWLYQGVLIYNMQQWGWAPWVIELVGAAVRALAAGTFGLVLVIWTIWLERKVSARIQDRIGPNRVGPFGLFQTFPDVVKLLTKEYITPAGADLFVYNFAPLLAVMAVVLLWAVIPFSRDVLGTNVNIGVIYLVAVGSLGTLAILMAGWSSNNKYALLGAFRTVAQLVSYEVPMILSLLVPVLLARSMAMNTIVDAQPVWFIVLSPIAALVFFISSLAEVGRTPFDLLEAESEIVAGFHIEYTGMKFGMFYLAEFLHAFTICALTTVLFLGGWRGPLAQTYPVLGLVYFFIKTFAVYFLVMLIRTTFPRIRIDHMLDFNWKFLVPLSLANLLVLAVIDKLPWAAVPAIKNAAGQVVADPSIVANLPRAALLLGSNLALLVITVLLIRFTANRARKRGIEPAAIEAREIERAEHAAAH